MNYAFWGFKADTPQTCVDVAMAVIGYLLYGDKLLDEVTTNMIKTEGYSRAVKITIMVMVATVPITKFPLQCVHHKPPPLQNERQY